MKRLLQQLGEKGSRYDPDAILYFNQLTGSLPVSFKNAVSTYVRALKAAGIWTQLDRLWLHATPNQQNARISIVNPTSTPITEVNAPTWTANLGYTGNGATSYLNTNYNSLTSSFNFTQNSACYGLYSRTNTANSVSSFGIDDNVVYSVMFLRFPADISYFYLNNAASAAGAANTTTLGLFMATRSIAARLDLYKNGVSYGSELQVSNGLANRVFYILSWNSLSNGGVAYGFDTRQVSLSVIGGGGINQSDFYTATQALAVAIGFNV